MDKKVSTPELKEGVKKLTQEDFNMNPELNGMGFKVGDHVEVPTHAIAQVEVNDAEELMVDVNSVALTKDEELRIIITRTKDGFTAQVKAQSDEIDNVEIVGLLEYAKADIMAPKPQQPQPTMSKYDAEMIEHTITEEDLSMYPELADLGHKVNATIKLPRIAVNGLLQARTSNQSS